MGNWLLIFLNKPEPLILLGSGYFSDQYRIEYKSFVMGGTAIR